MNGPETPESRFAKVIEQVYDALEELTEANPFPPTRKEIAEHLGIEETRVRRAIDRLKAAGRVGDAGGPRTLHITY